MKTTQRSTAHSPEQISESLNANSWLVIENFLPQVLFEGLCHQARSLPLNAAQIGSRHALKRDESVRQDRTCWLEEDSLDPHQLGYFSAMRALMSAFNAHLWLNLTHLEAHFALYLAHQFYARHLDATQLNNQRIVSTVYYLNPSWHAEDLGALRLYPPQRSSVDILPTPNRLAIFLSESVEHEVLAPLKPRYSIAGWLRRRDDRAQL